MYSKLQDGSFIVAGFVPRDAELKQTQSGKSYTTWSVKVAVKPPVVAGEHGEAVWTDCKAWHDLARLAAKIKKGDTVLAIGKLETREYEGKTYKTLNCEYISIMDKGAAAAPVQQAQSSNDIPEGFEELVADDSLPF